MTFREVQNIQLDEPRLQRPVFREVTDIKLDGPMDEFTTNGPINGFLKDVTSIGKASLGPVGKAAVETAFGPFGRGVVKGLGDVPVGMAQFVSEMGTVQPVSTGVSQLPGIAQAIAAPLTTPIRAAEQVAGLAVQAGRGILGREPVEAIREFQRERDVEFERGVGQTLSGQAGEFVGQVIPGLALPAAVGGGLVARTAAAATGAGLEAGILPTSAPTPEESLAIRGERGGIAATIASVIPGAGQFIANTFIRKSPIPNADQLRRAASNLYSQAAEKGGVLKATVSNNFLGKVQKIKPQTVAGRILAGDDEFTRITQRLDDALRNKDISLATAQEVDELLGDAIDGFTDAGRLTKQGKKLFDIQSAFRETIEKTSTKDVVGGKEGFNILKDARKLWAKSRRLEDIERIIQRAELTDNPATSIKSGFRTLASNPKRLRGFTKPEQEAIRAAAKTGVVGDTLRIFGSRLIPIVAATGGSLGGTAGAAVGSFISRGGATALQAQRAQTVADLIARGGPDEPVPQRAVLELLGALGTGAQTAEEIQ